jgi:hypothetical protein
MRKTGKSSTCEYNFIYAFPSDIQPDRLYPILYGVVALSETGLFPLAMIGYITGICLFISKRNSVRRWLPLLSVGLIDFPIELILVGTSGRTFRHYYMALLPVFSLFAGLFFWAIRAQLSSLKASRTVKAAFVTGVLALFAWVAYDSFQSQIKAYRETQDDREAVRYIISTTSPDEYVLLWGARTQVNYFSQRRSPTRFAYQYPLYKKGYVNEQMIEAFLGEVIQNRPRLIIDTNNPVTPIFEFPMQSGKIPKGIAYLRSHYLEVQKIGSWVVYEYIGDN